MKVRRPGTDSAEVRVGQSTRLRSRLSQHVRTPPIDWWRGLAVLLSLRARPAGS